MEPEARAAAGLFLAFQAPIELPGVNNANFLRTALNAIRRARGEAELDAVGFLRLARAESKRLQFPDDMLKRNVNVGFSGGEKKRNEVLQMAILRPKLAVLDETDSGLDIDALRIVADGVNALRGPRLLGAGHHASPAAAGPPGAGPGARAEPGADHPLRRTGTGSGARGERVCQGRGGGGMNQPVPNGADAFLARFRGLRDRLPGDAGQRDMAAAYFAGMGLPTRRDEAWHYTSLRALGETSFQEPLTEVSSAPVLGEVPDLPTLVLVDGRYQPGLSTPPDGVTVGSFAEEPGFGHAGEGLPMVALNTMLAEDGVQLHVAAGVDAGTVVLLTIAPDGHRPIDFHPRHRIVLEAGARLSIIEIARGQGTYLHNAVTEVSVASHAVLSHVRLQDEGAEAFHVNTTLATIAEHGTYDAFVLTLGAKLARTEVHATLAGPHGAVHLNGAQMLTGSQHADITTVVRHERAELRVEPDGQERAERAVARRVPGADRGGPGGAEDGRLPDEPGAAAVAACRDRLQAAARDLRGRA